MYFKYYSINKDINKIIEYYDELISERIENGEKEADIIKSFGEYLNYN
jgi:uncharacterized membrane protein